MQPIRMCVICRRRFEAWTLARHVMDQDGVLILDTKRKRPGRGWYCCQDARCVARFAAFRPKGKRAAKKAARATGR